MFWFVYPMQNSSVCTPILETVPLEAYPTFKKLNMSLRSASASSITFYGESPSADMMTPNTFSFFTMSLEEGRSHWKVAMVVVRDSDELIIISLHLKVRFMRNTKK